MSRQRWLPRIAVLLVAVSGYVALTVYRDSHPTRSGQWRLVLDEQFTGSQINERLWHTCYWWADAEDGCSNEGNDELQWYQTDDVLLADSLLRLRAQEREVEDNYPYTSGIITSHPDFYFRYGYLEVRARVPRGRGLWPAVWLLPHPDLGSKPEIDVLEIIGQSTDIIDMSLHYRDGFGRERRMHGVYQGPDFAAGFHTYGLLWEPNQVTWYVDGIPRYAVRDFVPQVGMHVLVNLAVGGSMPGSPDADTLFPAYFEVDYLRIWQRPEHLTRN